MGIDVGLIRKVVNNRRKEHICEGIINSVKIIDETLILMIEIDSGFLKRKGEDLFPSFTIKRSEEYDNLNMGDSVRVVGTGTYLRNNPGYHMAKRIIIQ